MIEVKAPNYYQRAHSDDRIVFLAGSIEMGEAELWQDKVVTALADTDTIVLNPRRDDFDPTWTQGWENPNFVEQVNWEMDALEVADVIVFYFDPNTKSPITLMELGLYAKKGNVIVCCPNGFWRKGNVDILCKRYKLPTADSLEMMTKMLRYWIR